MRDDESDGISGEEAAPAPALPPRENPDLIGHGAAEAALLASYRSGRLPHAWLITGPRGVGKATLAFRFARFLFAQNQGDGLFAAAPQSLAVAAGHPAFRRVASGGHPDLLLVERGYNDKRSRRRSEIIVEDTRAISGFLHKTPAEGGWRVVIVDGADTMNPNASNALLKILEEPPKRAVLLLLSDNPGRLLATIRSRCRRLALAPLAAAEVAAALARLHPELAPQDAASLGRLSAGSIGRALELASSDGLALYRRLFNLLQRLPEIDVQAVNGFADKVARWGADEAFALVGELLPGWIARMVALAGGGEGDTHAVLPGEADAMRRLAGRRNLDQWVEVWENLTHLFAEANIINLDRKQVVLNVFFALEAAAR